MTQGAIQYYSSQNLIELSARTGLKSPPTSGRKAVEQLVYHLCNKALKYYMMCKVWCGKDIKCGDYRHVVPKKMIY